MEAWRMEDLLMEAWLMEAELCSLMFTSAAAAAGALLLLQPALTSWPQLLPFPTIIGTYDESC